MNEKEHYFDLDSCEVFSIKKWGQKKWLNKQIKLNKIRFE